MPKHCVYFGEPTGREYRGEAVYECQVYGECTRNNIRRMPSCDGCKQKLSHQDSDFAEKWIDPLAVVDRRGNKTEAIRDLLAGRPAFLVCGGPSATEDRLAQLARRGVWSIAVNNIAGYGKVGPQAFFCSDPPKKFSHSIWFDPKIMKIIPTPKMRGTRGKLRQKTPYKTWVDLKYRVCDCPNVWGFKRRSWLMPDDSFFTEDSAAWGNQDSGVRRTGQPKTTCTMLLGIRLLRYLGAKRIYLLGADFHMKPQSVYAFGQGKADGACESNNRQFRIVNEWLSKMQSDGVFKHFGLEIYNTAPASGLRAFQHVPFDRAILDCKGIVEDVPDLAYWYEKIDKEPEEEHVK